MHFVKKKQGWLINDLCIIFCIDSDNLSVITAEIILRLFFGTKEVMIKRGLETLLD